jgi:DNA polymerase-4
LYCRSKRGSSLPAQKKYIAHLDLDCFFVSVERIKDPSLREKPVAVGGSPRSRGVIASASYEARAYGVHSAMATARALRLCPRLIVVRGNHSEYSLISRRLHKRIAELAPVVEQASIDEMYMDFTGCEGLYNNDMPGFMKIIQKTVLDEFQLPCTIALSSNTLVSKIAANQVKPNGVCFVPHGTEAEYLAPLGIGVIPGIGKKTEEHLRSKGFITVADIQRKSEDEIRKILGKHGLWIYRAAWGRGSDKIGGEAEAKSISREETFDHDLVLRKEMERIMFELVEDVCFRLRRNCLRVSTITLKLRSSDFSTITHAESVEPTNDDAVVRSTVLKLFSESYTEPAPLRLIGVRLSNFENEEQAVLPLFPADTKKQDILHAVDGIRKKFGNDVIHMGGKER